MPVLARKLGTPRPPISVTVVRRRAERMLRALGLGDAELSVVLCDDRAMRALNLRHRDLDRPTDVLAFPIDEGPDFPATTPPWLGDVVISVPTAVRQARRAGRRPLDEISMLLAHGLLHLLGCDHRTRNEERRMQARTDALVSAGLGPSPRPVDRPESRLRGRPWR